MNSSPLKALRLAIAVLAGMGYVASHAQTAQVRYSQTYIGGSFGEPSAIAYDQTSAALYVVDLSGNSRGVFKLTPATGVYTQSTVVSNLSAIGIAIDSAGNVIVGDTNANIFKFTPNGNGYTKATLLTGSNAYALAVDSAGDLFFSNGFTLTKATPAGGSYTLTTIDSGFSNLCSIAVDPAGNLYLADSSSNIVSKETLSGGKYTRSQIGSGFSQPLSVSLDASGDVYVADSSNARIVKEVPNGTVYTPAPAIPLMYQTPGATTDPAGNIYNIIYFLQSGISKISPIEEADAPALAFGSIPVGTQSSAMSATFNFLVGGTLATTPYTVVTQGSTALGFQPAAQQQANVCVSGHTYSVGDTCTVSVTFKPGFPGTHYGGIELTNTAGAVVGTAYITGYGVGPLAARPPVFLFPPQLKPENISGIAVDSAGNLFFNDQQNGIFEENPVTGVFTYSGNGLGVVPGTAGGGYSSVALDGNGNMYTYGAGANSSFGTVVYVTMLVNGAYSSSNRALVGSNLAGQGCIAVDGAGNIYVADTAYNRVVKETYLGGAYSQSVLFSGLGAPMCVAVDGNGKIFISDTSNNRVLLETPGANGYTQSVLTSNVTGPGGLVLDGVGNLYIADNAKQFRVLRETLTGGSYTESVYSADTSGYTLPTVPYLALDPNTGNLYGSYGGIFGYSAQTPQSLMFASTAVGSTSSDSPQTVSVINIGNAPLTFAVPSSGLNPALTSGFQYSNSSSCPQLSGVSTPATLAPNATCTESISFVPVASGTITGTLTTADNNLNVAGSTQIVKLNGTGTGAAAATATLTPATANFGSVQVGGSASLPLTLTNTGATAITVTGVAIPSPLFTLSSQTCGTTLAAGANCTYTVTYTPTATGAASSTFSVTDTAGTQSSALSGTGLAAGSLAITPTTQAFPATSVGATSAVQTSTISNTTAQAIYLSSGSLTDANDFTQSDNCNGLLGAGKTCTVSFTFTPKAAGALTSTYAIHDLNNPGTPLTVALSGTGNAALVPQAVLSPSALTFTTVPNTQAYNQTLTLSNPGTGTLNIASILISGTNASTFAIVTNACGGTLNAGASCAITVGCTAIATGTYTALLTVTDNATPPTQSASLTCTVAGTPQASLAPAAVNFGNVNVGAKPAASTITLTNAGTAALGINSISLQGTNAANYAIAGNACGLSLAAGASCAVTVTFSPTAAGSTSATLTVIDAVGTQTSALSGTGVATVAADFTIAATPAEKAYRGTSVSYTVQLTSLLSSNPFGSAVTLSATGLPAGTTVSFAPATLVPGAATASTSVMTVTIPPLAAALHVPVRPSRWPRGKLPEGATVLTALALCFTRRRKARGLQRLLSAVLMLGGMATAAMLSGCGTSNGFGVPTTTSVITVTATSGTTVHSTQVTLTIL